MRPFRLPDTCVLLCIIALSLSSGKACALEENQPAPPFRVQLLDGTQIQSNALKGRVVILHFWASWCEACQTEMPILNNYYRQHQQEELQVIAISLDDKHDEEAVRALSKDYAFPVALEYQSKMQGFGRIWALPLTFVIDREGILRKDASAHPWLINNNTLDAVVTPWLIVEPGK